MAPVFSSARVCWRVGVRRPLPQHPAPSRGGTGLAGVPTRPAGLRHPWSATSCRKATPLTYVALLKPLIPTDDTDDTDGAQRGVENWTTVQRRLPSDECTVSSCWRRCTRGWRRRRCPRWRRRWRPTRRACCALTNWVSEKTHTATPPVHRLPSHPPLAHEELSFTQATNTPPRRLMAPSHT